MDYIIIYNDELYHHGVKGMKWGVRKDERYISAKNAYRQANKEYNAAYNKAHSFSTRHPVSQHIKRSKNYEMSNKLWGDAYDAGKKVHSTKEKFKDTKKHVKKEKYRDRLATRAQLKSNMNKMHAKSKQAALDDLDKHGRNSQTYKNARDAHIRNKKREFEQRHGSGTYTQWEAIADAFSFEYSRTTMKELREDLTSSKKSYTSSARKWSSRKRALMNMPISSMTTKKDIKSVYKGK